MKNLLKTFLALTAATVLAISARADSLLYLSDGTNSITVMDGDSNDDLASADNILFNGAMGNWDITVTTGLVGGSAENPNIHLNSVVHSTGAGNLFIFFMSDDFGPSAGYGAVEVGGTTSGNSQFWVGSNPANDLNLFYINYATQVLTNAFSEAGGFMVNLPAYYSLGIAAQINHSNAGFSSFDVDLKVPDRGTTALLMALGLAGIVLAARRRQA